MGGGQSKISTHLKIYVNLAEAPDEYLSSLFRLSINDVGIAGPNLNVRLISRSLEYEPTYSGPLKSIVQFSHNYISNMCPCVSSWESNSGWEKGEVSNLATVPTQPYGLVKKKAVC